MPDTLIPDTSCLIFLEKIEELDILKSLYKRVLTTNVVEHEYQKPLPTWIEVKTVREGRNQKVLEQILDRGEASIIGLSLDGQEGILAIDDLKARKLAKALEVPITGTLGLIYNAKKEGLIASTTDCIQKLKVVGFRISDNIEQEIIRLSGE